MFDSVSEFQPLVLPDNGLVKVSVFIGPSLILSDVTESRPLIAQSTSSSKGTILYNKIYDAI